jgi:hypothetical protein
MRRPWELPPPWFELAMVGIAVGCGIAFGLVVYGLTSAVLR